MFKIGNLFMLYLLLMSIPFLLEEKFVLLFNMCLFYQILIRKKMKKISYFKQISLIALAFVSLTFASCKKEETTPEPAATTGTVSVSLEHKWVDLAANFTLNMEYIHPVTNDTLNFTTMKYYISNLKLKKSDGTWWTHPESYFLVDLENQSSTKLMMSNVPVGTYTELSYTFGVDSTRNVSGAQSGALSIANNMFWSWNSGYIFMKAEGISNNSTTGSYSFHLGGFTGVNNVVSSRTDVFNIQSTDLIVSSHHQSEIGLLVFPDKLFNTTGTVNGTNTIHMPGAMAKTMANDFFNGIVFEHVHN
jgi:hypothetical protein